MFDSLCSLQSLLWFSTENRDQVRWSWAVLRTGSRPILAIHLFKRKYKVIGLKKLYEWWCRVLLNLFASVFLWIGEEFRAWFLQGLQLWESRVSVNQISMLVRWILHFLSTVVNDYLRDQSWISHLSLWSCWTHWKPRESWTGTANCKGSSKFCGLEARCFPGQVDC